MFMSALGAKSAAPLVLMGLVRLTSKILHALRASPGPVGPNTEIGGPTFLHQQKNPTPHGPTKVEEARPSFYTIFGNPNPPYAAQPGFSGGVVGTDNIC